jgi:hypothetical protein
MDRRSLFSAGLYLSCAVLGWIVAGPLEGSELSGGSVTGPVLALHDKATDLFLLGAVAVYVHRRTAAGITLLGGLFALPLYFYLVAPGPFRVLFPGEYKQPVTSQFHAEPSAVLATVATLAAIVVSLRSLRRPLE